MSGPDLSVVVLNWNTAELLERCLDSLARAPAARRMEVVVVDNASSDDSVERVSARHPWVQLVQNEANVGYAAGNNVGIRVSRGRFVLLLNSDTEVEPGALDRLVSFLEEHRGYGAAAPRLVGSDGLVQRACMRFPNLLTCVAFDTWFGRRGPLRREIDRYFYRDFDHLESRDVDQPPAAALLLRRSALDRVGLLDEDLFLFFNDVDLCRRLRLAGFRLRYVADAVVRHVGGASTSRYGDFALEWHLNRARYYLRAYGRFGFLLAKAMTLWRAAEEWFKTVPFLSDPEQRRAAERDLERVVRAVLADPGRFDPRLAPAALRVTVQNTSESPMV